MTNNLKILQAQIHNDSQDIIDSLQGDIDWEGIIQALDRINGKAKKFRDAVQAFKNAVQALVDEAEKDAQNEADELNITRWKEEKK